MPGGGVFATCGRCSECGVPAMVDADGLCTRCHESKDIVRSQKRVQDTRARTEQEGDLAAATVQPLPTGDGQEVTPLVLADLRARSAAGVRKYGTTLRAHNGRDALLDAYQEALNLVCYLRQELLERDGK